MGDKGLEAIRTGRKSDLLSRLSADFSQSVRRLAADDARPAGEWKSLNLPMLYGGDLSRVNLHYRSFERDADAPGQGKKQAGMRFIMDIALSRMGPMQIDGFSIGRKLDVTLRSEQALSPAMREAMRTRYHDAVSNIGFSGELNFNASPDHKGWIVTDSVQGFGRTGTATA